MRTTALTALVTLTLATAASAQGTREIEVGGGWMEFNPLDIDDFTSVPSGPILDGDARRLARGRASRLGRSA